MSFSNVGDNIRVPSRWWLLTFYYLLVAFCHTRTNNLPFDHLLTVKLALSIYRDSNENIPFQKFFVFSCPRSKFFIIQNSPISHRPFCKVPPICLVFTLDRTVLTPRSFSTNTRCYSHSSDPINFIVPIYSTEDKTNTINPYLPLSDSFLLHFKFSF